MKNFLKLSALLVTFILFAFIPNNEKIKVVIDAGHGGTDFGATQYELTEKEIVAEISQKIKNLNNNENIEIHFTRNDDKMMTLQERVDFIKNINPDVVISLHTNASKNIGTYGMECFVSDKESTHTKSNEYAEKLLTEFTSKMNLKSRGVNKAPFFILKKTEVPAIIVELGFLSNDNDRAYLSDRDKQIEMAQTILNFISSIKK